MAATHGTEHMTKFVLLALVSLGTLAFSAASSAAPNYTDQERECLNVCRQRDICHGLPGSRDNSPRCKRCVAACAQEEKQKESQKK
jgi:hypothetical protein